MSLPSRFLLVFLPALLIGCGFEPMYGKKEVKEKGSKVYAGVAIDSMPGRNGQMLREKLEDKLNPDGAVPSKPAYHLNVLFKSSAVPIGVARDGTVSRYNVYLTSKYVLYRNSDGKPVTSGDIGYVDSFNNLTNAYFSTYISEEDAFKNGINELSELYREHLTAYLDEGAPVEAVRIPSPGERKTTVPMNPLLYGPDPNMQTPYQQ